MDKPLIRIHNAETNEIIDREMTDDEFAKYEEDKLALNQQILDEEAKAQAKLDVLNRLGITQEEAQLLLS